MTKDKNEKLKVIKKKNMEVILDNIKNKSPSNHTMQNKREKTLSIKDELEQNVTDKYKNYKILDLKAFKTFLLEVKMFLFGITLEKSNYTEKNEKEILKQIRLPIKCGLVAIGVTFGFFGIWSGLAPLDSASIAEGYIIVSDHKKEIFHEGGSVVEKILVKDGDEVKKDQPLIVLNKYKAKAELDSVLWQLRYTIVTDKKLFQCLEIISCYQNENKDKIKSIHVHFNNKYLDGNDQKILKLIEAQKNSFKSFKAFIDNSIQTFTSQIDKANSEIDTIKKRIHSYKETITTLAKEYERKKQLHEKKLETTERLSQIKLQLQEYKGRELEERSKLVTIQHSIAETTAKKSQFMDDQNVKLSEEYKKNHTELLRLEAAYISSQDTHKRTTIVAPNSGIITGLNVHTAGSILRQDGRPVLEIIPQDDNLVIEAYIPSQEIDSINVGSEAKIQLNAYKARLVPRIVGKVFYISADKYDQQSGGMIAPGQYKLTPVGYYKTKIAITSEELAKVNTDIKLYPGMPVTVFLVKGTRSFAQYLYSPIKDSFHRAFKEP